MKKNKKLGIYDHVSNTDAKRLGRFDASDDETSD
jgi:hypothetical protein